MRLQLLVYPLNLGRANINHFCVLIYHILLSLLVIFMFVQEFIYISIAILEIFEVEDPLVMADEIFELLVLVTEFALQVIDHFRL